MNPPTRQPQFTSVLAHLQDELAQLRTGRATPAFVEPVRVEAYGSTLPLVQLASVTVPDARTILIQPWDRSVLKDIERALQQANLGLTPVNDGTVIRLVVPPLTEERRREYQKLLNQKLEQARVAARKIREDELKMLRTEKTEGRISEDALFAKQKDLQQAVDAAIAEIDALGATKDAELMTV